MKKTLIQMMTIFLVILSSVGLNSCSNDEDDNDNPEALIGRWTYDSTSSDYSIYEFVDFYTKNNGRVYFCERGKTGDFSYEVSDGKINYIMRVNVNFGIGSYKDEGSWQYHLKGNILYLNNMKFTREVKSTE